MGGPASPRLRSGRRSEARSAKEGGEEGEVRVASERFRPTGVQEGATGMPVGLHAACSKLFS